MLIKLVLAMMVLLMITVTNTSDAVFTGQQRDQQLSQLQMEDLRGFAMSVALFIKATPEFTGVLTWQGDPASESLRNQSTTPPALRDYAMPVDWRAVAIDGQYVICGQLRPQTIAMVSQRMPASSKGISIGDGLSPDYIVFAKAESAQEQLLRCQ